MLALFPDLQQINIIEYANGQKVVETSLTREDANNIVGHDVSEYGENLILWRIEVIDGIIYDREKLEQIFNQISIISTS